MENPATWGPLERAIDSAMKQAEKDREAGMVGLSNVRRIADAVREVQAAQDTLRSAASERTRVWRERTGQ